jgi:hypothetical protein
MECDREGTFRAQITSYGLQDSTKSQSVGIMIRASLLEIWNGEAWEPWGDYLMEAEGTLWVIKSDGTPNTNSAESLCRYAGWDGTFESIANNTWQPTPCQVVIKEDSYKNETRYRIEFVNDLHRTPGQMSSVSPEKVRELSARHGSALRAIAGNVHRGSAAPQASRPSAPPPAARKFYAIFHQLPRNRSN